MHQAHRDVEPTTLAAGERRDLAVGDGNEVAHIDLIIGPRGSPAEAAFCNGLVNNKHGFTSLLAVIAPNLPCVRRCWPGFSTR